METLLRIGLSNAVAALLLALLIVIVACVWRRPAVLHALWLLVLVKLMTPPLVWLPDPWSDAATVAPASGGRPPPDEVQNQGADAPRSPAPEVVDAAPADPPATEFVIVQAAAVDAAPAEAPAAAAPVVPAPQSPPWLLAALFGLWLAGAVGWYALALVRLRRFRRLLRHAVPAPESLRQRMQRLAEKLRLRRRPAVWLVPGRVAPMLWAAGGSPCILFPSELLGRTTTEQQNALLVHELAHLRRRDHWVRWLEFAASGLYWWNPVLWFARRELREAEEHCCDAWVTSTLPGAGKTYAVALLETLDFLADAPRATPMLASGVGRVADLKRRLTMIMRGRTPRALSWRGLLAVLGLGALLLPLLPAWARAQQPAKPDAPDKPEVRALRFLVDNDAPSAPADIEKAKAELQELQALLAKKQAETAELSAKIEALRARLAKTETPDKNRFFVTFTSQGPNPDTIKDKLQQLLESMPGAGRVIILDQATGKIMMEINKPTSPAAAMPAPGQPFNARLFRWVVVPQGDLQITTPASPADADKRLDELEKKIKSILDEVEQLRRERKPGDAPLPSQGQAPQEKLPRVNATFKIVPADPAVTREERIRQLEEEVRKLKEANGDAPKRP